MPSSLIVPLVTAGISGGANALFNSRSGNASAPLENFSPSGFAAGGLTTTFSGGNYGVSAGPDRMAAVGNIANTFGTQADALGGLRTTVAPGFSDFRKAGLSDIENARLSSIGNLRENLQRRRVLGSSFAQDAASRAEAEFGQTKAKFEASSYLAELEATTNLMQQEFTARRSQFQTGLDEMNLEATLAANLTGKATDILGKNAQMEAQLNFLSQKGQGSFFSQLVQPVAAAAGKAAGGINFGGGGADPFAGAA